MLVRMILPRHLEFHTFAFSLLFLSTFTYAQEDGNPFDCHISYGDQNYDLNSLAGERSVSRTRESPPSVMVDTVIFNLCADLQPQERVDEVDQCPSGTRACLTKTNRKGNDDDRIVAVIPLAKSATEDMDYSSLSSPKGLSVTFKGPSYPSSTSADPIPQSFNVRLLCSTEDSGPSWSSYDGSQMIVEWSTPSGCGSSSSDMPAGDEPAGDIDDDRGQKEKAVGSGVGYFFLL
ncbi:hypothetical protein AcV5_006955 [Taiwanofungus camphoratus]|nr:hypothetical protein AcV5_006955 [Antrodia cinnamomea]